MHTILFIIFTVQEWSSKSGVFASLIAAPLIAAALIAAPLIAALSRIKTFVCSICPQISGISNSGIVLNRL